MKRTQSSPRSATRSSAIRFTACLHRPADSPEADWTFLVLPKQASAKLPSRGMVSVTGKINGNVFQATLQPDGNGGHWLQIDRTLRRTLRGQANPGDVVELEITPLSPDQEPEPTVPADLRKALTDAPAKARDVWQSITPVARRDWIQWIVSAKQADTRARRIANACDMLAHGKRRPCCFDRSGMYGKNLSCPTPMPIPGQSRSSSNK